MQQLLFRLSTQDQATTETSGDKTSTENVETTAEEKVTTVILQTSETTSLPKTETTKDDSTLATLNIEDTTILAVSNDNEEGVRKPTTAESIIATEIVTTEIPLKATTEEQKTAATIEFELSASVPVVISSENEEGIRKTSTPIVVTETTSVTVPSPTTSQSKTTAGETTSAPTSVTEQIAIVEVSSESGQESSEKTTGSSDTTPAAIVTTPEAKTSTTAELKETTMNVVTEGTIVESNNDATTNMPETEIKKENVVIVAQSSDNTLKPTEAAPEITIISGTTVTESGSTMVATQIPEVTTEKSIEISTTKETEQTTTNSITQEIETQPPSTLEALLSSTTKNPASDVLEKVAAINEAEIKTTEEVKETTLGDSVTEQINSASQSTVSVSKETESVQATTVIIEEKELTTISSLPNLDAVTASETMAEAVTVTNLVTETSSSPSEKVTVESIEKVSTSEVPTSVTESAEVTTLSKTSESNEKLIIPVIVGDEKVTGISIETTLAPITESSSSPQQTEASTKVVSDNSVPASEMSTTNSINDEKTTEINVSAKTVTQEGTTISNIPETTTQQFVVCKYHK
uniref:Uncharacterized protein n=1 Tax=Panagrolaimus superbus TaxID=310955 RepID=A0A914Z3P7_9BILA